MRFLLARCLVTLLLIDRYSLVAGLIVFPVKAWTEGITVGYNRRVAADPSFPIKSIAEVLLAASTQFAAEIKNRGATNVLPQIDFVFPAILTAIAGKYISMWKTAKTQTGESDAGIAQCKIRGIMEEPSLFRMTVPTNAFQRTMLDGVTAPKLKQRLGSLIVPMVPLFRAGCTASFLGYGFTAVVIQLRHAFIPSYVTVTQSVNVLGAALYTGALMAVVSNIRYQILQGILEPAVDRFCHVGNINANTNVHVLLQLLRGALIFAIRICNGLLGSMLAIAGMKLVGLQRLK